MLAQLIALEENGQVGSNERLGMQKSTALLCTGAGPQSSATPPPEIAATLSVLSGKWKLLIIWSLYRGTARFNTLKRGLPGLTQHTLTAQLRELESEGIVSRQIFAEVPARVEYSLTEHGKTLGHVLQTLAQWGRTHLKRRGRF
jgi:DNA-binding HxlR family transcriptional regulator